MLKVVQTKFLQGWKKKFVCVSKEEKRISFIGIAFGKGFAVFIPLWEREIDAADINEIENVVQGDKVDVICRVVQVNYLSVIDQWFPSFTSGRTRATMLLRNWVWYLISTPRSREDTLQTIWGCCWRSRSSALGSPFWFQTCTLWEQFVRVTYNLQSVRYLQRGCSCMRTASLVNR